MSAISAGNSHFANLDLRLWYLDDGGEILVAQSVSEYNNVEHLFLALEREGEYRLEAAFKDMVYGDAESETFAVAWNVSQIPEPSSARRFWGRPPSPSPPAESDIFKRPKRPPPLNACARNFRKPNANTARDSAQSPPPFQLNNPYYPSFTRL